MKARTTTMALVAVLAVAASAAPNPQSPTSSPKGVAAPTGPTGAPVSASDKPVLLTPEQLRTIDDSLSKAEVFVLDAESVAKGGGDGSGCPAGFTVREYMQDMRAKRISKQTGDDLLTGEKAAMSEGGAKLEWQLYYLCQAIAMKNPMACADAASVSAKTLNRDIALKSGLQDPNAMSEEEVLQKLSSQNYDGKCTISYYQETARAAFLSKSPKFLDICKQAAPRISDLKDPAASEAMCRAWQGYNGDPDPFVRAIEGGVAHPLKRDFALGVVREMTVAPGVCATLKREYDRRLCREQEDFRKAAAAHDAGQCRGGICRVLMGDGLAACESFARKFKPDACTQVYAGDFVASREKSFKALADQIETFLGGSDAGMGNLKQLKELNARLDRLYDLRDRFDRAAETVAPKKIPAPAAKKRG